MKTLLFFLLFALSLFSTAIVSAASLHPTGISKNENFITFDGKDFLIKSIYLHPWMPGENPALGEDPLKANYSEIMSAIKATGANTISVFYTVWPVELFRWARVYGLKIILGLWIYQDAPDFQNMTFKNTVKNYIKNMIDNYHNANGTDYSEDILFLNIGNEFSEGSIRATNSDHPDITIYNGTYISAPSGSNATECFLAEMCDYAAVYEVNTYGVYHYISHSTWSPVSPDLLNTSFLDIVSYNIYSFWPEWMLTHPGGSATGSPYQGYIERMKSTNRTKPFYISEFGYSTAPLKPDSACVSEQEQSSGIKTCWQDITTANPKIAGGAVYDYQDNWWEQANTASWPSVADEDEHAQDDREEWFGIMKIDGSSPTNYTITKKPAYYAVQEMFTQTVTNPVATTTASTSWAYPNPCSKSKNIFIMFSNIQEKTKLEIYTLAGELVFQSALTANSYQWNLQNYDDQIIAPGVYLVRISEDGKDEWLKIAILP